MPGAWVFPLFICFCCCFCFCFCFWYNKQPKRLRLYCLCLVLLSFPFMGTFSCTNWCNCCRVVSLHETHALVMTCSLCQTIFSHVRRDTSGMLQFQCSHFTALSERKHHDLCLHLRQQIQSSYYFPAFHRFHLSTFAFRSQIHVSWYQHVVWYRESISESTLLMSGVN